MVTNVLTLGLAPWAVGLLTVGFLAICLLLVLIVLIQRPQGGGLSAAFGAGGGGSGQTAFGAKTGDALTLATVGIFVLFLVGAVVLNFAIRPSEEGEQATQTSSEQAPATAGGEGADAPTATIDEDETPATEAPAEEQPESDDASGAEEPAPTPAPTDDQPVEDGQAGEGDGR